MTMVISLGHILGRAATLSALMVVNQSTTITAESVAALPKMNQDSAVREERMTDRQGQREDRKERLEMEEV